MMNGKRIFIRFLVTLLAVQGAVAAQLLTLPSAKAADSTREVVVNEIMWMGSSVASSDEWIELYNTTNLDIDIGGWRLTSAGTSDATLIIPAGRTIPAGGYFLISNYASASPNTILDLSPGWVTTSIQLDNSCDIGEDVYTNLLDASAEVIDQVGCESVGGDLFAGLNGPTYRSMERTTQIGDGLVAASWQTSEGFVNLKSGAWPNHAATPGYENDSTGPIHGFVNDGTGDDIDWTIVSDPLSVNWGGFHDDETGLSGEYLVGIGTTPGGDEIVGFDRVTATSFNFVGLTLSEDVLYYTTVAAFNGAGVLSDWVISDGQRINTTDPIEPTNGNGSDVPNDNGGSVSLSWDPSISLDVVGYEVWQRKTGDLAWTNPQLTATNSIVFNGLDNGQSYDFAVSAIDFNDQRSNFEGLIIVAIALDNLAPILSKDKVGLSQNAPGTADSIAGADGATNERVTVNVLDRDPALPGALVLGSVESLDNGSFPAIGIGDNSYGKVWIQLIDKDPGVPASVPASFENDIIGPNAPTLKEAVSNCDSQTTCRVELSWVDNGPDSVSYAVGYITGGVEKKTTPQGEKTVVLDLENGKAYDFVVYAYDRYGNVSVKSNIFFLALNRGVKTVVTFVNGEQSTTTEGIPGSTAVTDGPVPLSQSSIVPKAQAAEPSPTPTVDTKTESANQDWSRIFIVVILLLVVAGGFYMLSRSFKDGQTMNVPEEQPQRKVVPPASQKQTKKNTRKKKR